jgi:acyl-CoA dehydrogenase
MSIFQTERLRKVLPQIKEYVVRELYPLNQDFLHRSRAEVEAMLQPKRQEVKSLGWWTPHLAEEEGGMGLNLVEFAQVSEVLGGSPVGHFAFNCNAPDIGNTELLHKFGSDYHKHEFMEPMIQGKIRSCFAMTEPGHAGSNPVWMSSKAVQDGDEWVVEGHKWFTSAADGAQFAVAMVVTSPDNPNPYARASMIIVPTDTPGYQLVRNIPVMGGNGNEFGSHSEVKFSQCRVPLKNLINTEGSGFTLAQERLGPGRIHHCMRWIGICEMAFDLMCKRAVQRELGPGKPLGTQQTIQNWIAESRAGIDAARYMVLHAAMKMQNEGQQAARREISTIKFYVAKVLAEVLDKAIQVHGALGITDDTILSYFYRHERGARIYDGPDEVHKGVLARSILKEYGLKTS